MWPRLEPLIGARSRPPLEVVDEVDRMGEELGIALRRGISREERKQLVGILQKLRTNLRAMEKLRAL